MGPPRIPPFKPVPIEFVGIELIYLIVVVLLCLLIYFKTREFYELTKHKGIYYFRCGFLFLAIAYLLRFIAVFFAMSGHLIENFNMHELGIMREVLAIVFTSVTYMSSMAILYLAYSLAWKRIRYSILLNNSLLHASVLVLSIAVFFTRSHLSLIFLQTGLLLLLAFMAYINYKTSEKKKTFLSQIYVVYFLLFLFWIINLFVLGRPFLEIEIRVLFYFISALIMGLVAYRVVRRVS